jgi:hypothetical protein
MSAYAPVADGDSMPRSYSPALWKACIAGAFALALIPIPVATLGLLPAYRVQAQFLAFYTPVVCLVFLGYLFYLRDRLARTLFASVLDPAPPPDPYYGATTRRRMAHLGSTLRRAFMAALPALLLLASVCCVLRYNHRLSESVALAGEDIVLPDTGEHELAYMSGANPDTSPDHAQDGNLADAMPPVVAAEPVSAAARARILQRTGIDDIPLFGELSVLYIGVFVTALAALTLMALREYAKDAMGLSEEDLVLGDRPVADEE